MRPASGSLASDKFLTRMQSAIHNLLRIPELLIHVPDLARLVTCQQLFRLLQALRAGEKCPT